MKEKRILEETEVKKEDGEDKKKEENNKDSAAKIEEEMDPAKKFKNTSVLKLDLNAVIPLDEFTSDFSDPGINLFDNGVLAKFDNKFENLYEKIKKAKEKKETDLAENEDEEGGEGESG